MAKQQFFFKPIAEMSGREVFCVARLRIDTFVTEQKITVPELDDDDLQAIQVFSLNKQETKATACCRIFEEDGRWMLGRVAVDQRLRGQNLGTQMMQCMHNYLKERGITRLYCHAQLQAKPFYDHLGYQTQGDVFTEADVKHVLMYCDL